MQIHFLETNLPNKANYFIIQGNPWNKRICIGIFFFTPLAHIFSCFKKNKTSSLYFQDWYWRCSSTLQPDECHHLVSVRWDCQAFLQVSVEMSGESQSEAAVSGQPGYQWAHPSLGRSLQETWKFCQPGNVGWKPEGNYPSWMWHSHLMGVTVSDWLSHYKFPLPF